LFEECKGKKVALVSDCGTPGFCDPGQRLVELYRKAGLAVDTAPGASSLMGLLSLTSRRINSFVFEGFLPQEKEERQKRLRDLSRETRSIVLMDTPYRLQRVLDDLSNHFSKRTCLLAINLTQPDQLILEGAPVELKKRAPEKAEFVVLVY
jgi:16S rRNA (cytidine1402-2'-O)-methyltransferase